MSSIDERVVKMEFDNKQFESGVSETMSSLQKLKMALKMRGSEEGISNVQKAANSLSFGAINDQIYQVQQHFSFFSRFVVNMFDRIANKVIDLGSTMVRELTTEPLKAGFSEYQLQMDSTQTIMASTGASIKTVSDKLDELNTYADKTIYSFSDMTANIGKFTNAGVSLDDAVSAIQGISNEAAVSGANANEASRAMYNFAQALSAGSVKLIDWKSIENANMATVEFKDELINTALALGTLKETEEGYVSTTTDANGKVSDAFTATKAFNESLSAQWMTTDVLIETLSHYSNDVRDMSKEERKAYEERLRGLGYTDKQIKSIEKLGKKAFDSAQDVKTFSQLVDTVKESLGSGWTKSFQYMIGNLEEAKVLWTGVNKEITAILDPIANAREEMLKFWHDNGGRDKAIAAIGNAWAGVKSMMGAVTKAFQEVFPPLTGERLVEITEAVHRLSERFKTFASSQRTISNLQFIFGGLASVFKLLARAARDVYDRLKPLLDIFGDFGGSLADAAAYFGRFLKQIADAENPFAEISDASKFLDKGFRRIVTGLDKMISSILRFVKIDIKGNPLTKLYDTMSGFFKGKSGLFGKLDFSGIGTAISGAFSGIGSIFSGGAGKSGEKEVSSIGDRISSSMGSVATSIKNVFSGILPSTQKGTEVFVGFLSGMGTAVSDVAAKVTKKIPEIFDYFGSQEFKNFVSALKTLAGGSLLVSLTNLINTYNDLAKKKLDKKGFINGISDAIASLVKGVTSKASGILDSLSTSISKFQMAVQTGQLIVIAVSLVLLAHSIETLASIDADRAADAVGTLTITMMMLLGGLRAVQTLINNTGGISDATTALIKMAIALVIMSKSVETLAKIPFEQLAQGLASVATLVVVFAVATRALDGAKVGLGAIVAITSTAIAIKILEKSIKTFSKLKWSDIAVGLSTVGSLMFEFIAFLTFLDGVKVGLSAIVTILTVASAVKMLEGTVKTFATMQWSQLAVGLSAVGSLLFELMAFTVLIGGASVNLSAIVTLVTITGVVLLLSETVKSFAALEWSQIAAGLSAVGLLLLELAGFTILIGNASVGLSAIVTLIAVTSAIKMLEETVVSFSNLGGDKLLAGLGGITFIIGALVAALAALSYGSPMMLVGAAALVVVANAITMFVPAIESLAKLDAGGIAKAVIGITLALVGLSVGLAVLGLASPLTLAASLAFMALGAAAGFLGTGLTTLAAGMAAFAGGLTASATAFIGSITIIAKGIGTLLEAIFIGIVNGIAQGIVTFANNITEILTAIGNALHTIGDFIIQNIPYVLSIVGTLVMSVLSLAVSFIPQFANVVAQFFLTVLTTIITWLPVIANTLLAGAVTLLNAVANGIRDNSEAILSAVSNIISSIIELVMLAIEDIVRLIPGVGDFLADKLAAGRELVQQNLAPDTLESYTTDAMGGAIKGVEKGGNEMASAATTAAETTKDSMAEQLTGGSDISGEFMGELIAGFVASNTEMASAGDQNVDAYLNSFAGAAGADQAGADVTSGVLAGMDANSMLFGTAGDVDISEYLKAFNPDAAAKKGSDMSSSAARGAGSSASKFGTAGRTGASKFTHSLGSASAAKAGKTLANTGVSGAGSTKGAYQTVGSSVASGFGWGVASPTAMAIARAAGVRLGHKAIEGIKDGVKSRSPSREAMKVGRQTTEGFVIGIDALSQVVYDQSAAVGKKSIDGIRDSISKMSKYVDMDMDFDPTIRPVLDLSEIQNGISQMNGMFSQADESLLVGFGNGGYANNIIGSLLNSGGLNSGVSPDMSQASNKTVNISLNLQYDASADANELARGIAYAVQPYVVRGV